MNANTYSTSVVVSSLEKNLAETLSVIEEVLFQPGFKQDDFDRIKQQMIGRMVYQHQQPEWLASQSNSPSVIWFLDFARSSDGTDDSIASLTWMM